MHKKRPQLGAFCMIVALWLLFHVTTVTVFELIDTTSGVDELRNTGEERVRFMRDIEFNKWVLVSVFPRDGFFCFRTRWTNKGVVVRHVFEDNKAVVGRMDIVFHFIYFSKMECKDRYFFLKNKNFFRNYCKIKNKLTLSFRQ